MKNNQNKWRSYQVKLLFFTLLLLTVPACISSRNSKDSSVETPSRNKSGDDIKKVENNKNASTKRASKTLTENAGTSDTDELSDNDLADSQDEDVTENIFENTDSLVKKVCRKYDSCGAQSYDDCMAEAEKVNYDDEVYECILKSSCKSLKLGQPDACSGAGNNPPVYEQKQAPCPQIRCSKNGDCPGTCYGGCKNGICLLF